MFLITTGEWYLKDVLTVYLFKKKTIFIDEIIPGGWQSINDFMGRRIRNPTGKARAIEEDEANWKFGKTVIDNTKLGIGIGKVVH